MSILKPASLALITLTIALSISPPHGASAQQSTSLLDGIFTTAQAERGKVAYATSCLSCHSADLRGSSVSPTLRGVGFLFNWEGRPLAELYSTLVENMPTDRPGSLGPGTYADILAYVLQVNGYPAGEQELAADQPDLTQMPIMAPDSAAR